MSSSQKETFYTSNDSELCTWWHDNSEVNPSGRVSNQCVRQSRRYLVQVSKDSNTASYHDSFVYETIPRNGNGEIYSPWDDPNGKATLVSEGIHDGVSVELKNGINMAWTQFVHSTDVKVKISTKDGSKLGTPADVVIRPVSTPYAITSSSDNSIEILVPRDQNGRRFSVEFKNDLYTYRSKDGNYVDEVENSSVVGIEPRNALLIFASPFLPEDKSPNLSGNNVHTMTPGPISKKADWGSMPILYFPPGVYWMNSNKEEQTPRRGENHIRLDPVTHWVHFAPGAYVKGAIEYSTQKDFYATGHGVLSGEHYVYQANPSTYYQALKSDKDSLRMWGHYNLSGEKNQTWYCIGPTINSPPFNTMDFYNNPERESPSVSVQISDYKQVGAFYMQTDGPQVYPGSDVHDCFYHANDDVIKTYYSNVKIGRIIVWKVFNDPVIQMGWKPRQVEGVKIDQLNIIHTRYRYNATDVPSAIIGASPFYDEKHQSLDFGKSISVEISNVTCEGVAPALLRITPLQNYANFRISNVSFPDGLQTGGIGTGQSLIPAEKKGDFGRCKMDLQISNWTVGGTKVTMENFEAHQLGQFNIDAVYWKQWAIQ